mmetsp:Transcript_34968/g.108248  ORF Transcript_34968/g.108248 Transcript_34968/m.108248 type:complete len:94 (-) Transcript_34968:15-296(-)
MAFWKTWGQTVKKEIDPAEAFAAAHAAVEAAVGELEKSPEAFRDKHARNKLVELHVRAPGRATAERRLRDDDASCAARRGRGPDHAVGIPAKI